jgi:hypothetical protein
MTSIRFSRRTLLHGSSLAATAAIPLLHATSSRGAATAPPTRLVIFTTPNGTRGDLFWPTGTETDFTLNTLTSPLEPFKSKLTFLKGVQLNAAVQARGAGSMHARGTGGMLTARPLAAGNFQSFAGNTSGWGTGQSIDQYLVTRLAPPTPFKSFHLGVHVRDTEVRARVSYSGADQPIPPREDPADVFSALFGAAGGGGGMPGGADPALTRLWAQRKSVFDATLAETQSLQGRVGSEDWNKLQSHIASMRDVEQRLVGTAGTTTPPSTNCSEPTLQAVDLSDDDQYETAGRLQMDLAAAALACDQTRILTFQWSYSESEHLFQFLDVNNSHHVISHDNSATSAADYDAIQAWYGQQFAYLLGRLDSYQEGDGTLLDNCIVLWTSEIGDGVTHDFTTLPCVLAGSAGGRIRAGRLIDFTSNRRDNNQMLISLAHAMGAEDLTTFGDPSGAMGPLPGLT